MTLEKIYERLEMFKEYLKFSLTFPSVYELMLDFKLTGMLYYTCAIPSFEEWLIYNGREDLAWL